MIQIFFNLILIVGANYVTFEEDIEKNVTLEDLCLLPPLGQEGYVAGDSVIFWNLCTTSGPQDVVKDGVKVGTLTNASALVFEKSGHYSLKLDHGELCEGRTNHTVNFDFFCNNGDPETDPQRSVVISQSSKCHTSLFWETDLICPSVLGGGVPSTGCSLDVPLFDQKLDLSVLKSATSFYPGE